MHSKPSNIPSQVLLIMNFSGSKQHNSKFLSKSFLSPKSPHPKHSLAKKNKEEFILHIPQSTPPDFR